MLTTIRLETYRGWRFSESQNDLQPLSISSEELSLLLDFEQVRKAKSYFEGNFESQNVQLFTRLMYFVKMIQLSSLVKKLSP